MTSAEFRRLSIQARNTLSDVTRATMKRLRVVFEQAADDIAARIAVAEMAGLSELTTASMTSINLQLEQAAVAVRDSLNTNGRLAIQKSVERVGTINDRFISEAFNRAGVTIIDRAVVGRIVAGVNTRVVTSVVNRIWQDGYTFSDRIWRVGRRYRDDLRNVLSGGLAQGRDALQIAKDLQVYVSDGKVRLMQRWDTLQRGTREFARRIPKNVDYRALRLVRTELYASLRDASLQHGLINPAATGLWDWIRQSSVDWGCDCPGFALDSPYTTEAVPGTPHANCLCAVVARLQRTQDFQDRLRKWDAGAADPGLDQWYQQVYLPAAAA